MKVKKEPEKDVMELYYLMLNEFPEVKHKIAEAKALEKAYRKWYKQHKKDLTVLLNEIRLEKTKFGRKKIAAKNRMRMKLTKNNAPFFKAYEKALSEGKSHSEAYSIAKKVKKK